MTLPQPAQNRLEDLLRDPREALDVEIKGWLDLTHNRDHKAKLAKVLLALKNHGGGYVIIGLTATDTGFTTASRQPANLAAYSQDDVSGIVHNYAEPAFHCSVHHEQDPTSGVIHPIIAVPGSHRVPVRAKRNGPNDRIVRQHTGYIRRPGPQSAPPLTGQEWDELFAKCLRRQRDHIGDLRIGRPSAAMAGHPQTGREDLRLKALFGPQPGIKNGGKFPVWNVKRYWPEYAGGLRAPGTTFGGLSSNPLSLHDI